MEEYYCTKCGAILNDQYGFDPNNSTWTCTSCGEQLMDDDTYEGDKFEGVAWYCDSCGELLNKQSGFTDSNGTWTCTNCYHDNPIDEDHIVNSKKSNLGFWGSLFVGALEGVAEVLCNRKSDDSESDESNDETKYYCPNCYAELNLQDLFDEDEEWTCENCFTKLKYSYVEDEYTIFENKEYKYDNIQYKDDNARYDVNYHNSYDNKGKDIPSKLSDTELRKIRKRALIYNLKKIVVGYDCIDLKGSNVLYVHTVLYNQAFKNIKLDPIKDLTEDNSYKIGIVDNISINGKTHFLEDDEFSYNSEVIITYHEKSEIKSKFSSDSLRKSNYKDVISKLKNIGFTNITLEPIKDLVTGWIVKDGSVDKVLISNKEIKKNKLYKYDEKITVYYHTKK